MDLGVRQIRTAGKGSGSIELTLPSELRDLVGLPCRITLRDGNRPDLVLQPDLRAAHNAFAAFWQNLLRAVRPDDADALRFPSNIFEFGLQHRERRAEKPFLCWRDGLILAGDPPHDPAAVARTLAAQASALAERLDIGPDHAGGFGAACGYLVAGVAAAFDDQDAQDLVEASLQASASLQTATLFDEASAAEACAAGVGCPGFWHRAAPLLIAAAEVFAAWTSDPSGYATAQATWRRGRAVEMNEDVTQ